MQSKPSLSPDDYTDHRVAWAKDQLAYSRAEVNLAFICFISSITGDKNSPGACANKQIQHTQYSPSSVAFTDPNTKNQV